MAMIRPRFVGPRQRSTRGKDWFGLGSFEFALAAGGRSNAWAILPSLIDVELTDPTLLAGRIGAAVIPTAVTATNTSALAIGLIVWNFVDDTVPAQVPGPLSDIDADWVWWWGIPLPSGAGIAG